VRAAPDDHEEDDPQPWTLIDEQFFLGHTYDPVVVAALRKLDPDIAPLWVVKTYDAPGHDDPQTVGRHLIARLIREPRVRMKREGFEKQAIRGVIMPDRLPRELEGLTSGPYFACELLEGESPDGDQPGPYLPMTMELVRRLETALWVIRNHTLSEMAANRLRNIKTAAAKRKAAASHNFREYIRDRRQGIKESRGELVRVPSSSGVTVSMSDQLTRLRKIAAEGATA
jgi:hypothetical protein